MEDLAFKELVANNLIYYRKKNNLTQFQLGKKIGYSDKTISKWERGEAIPDLIILNSLAKIYKIKIDNFTKPLPKEKYNPIDILRVSKQKFLILSLLLSSTLWFIATAIFTLLSIIIGINGKWWLSFIYAIPINAIGLIILNSLYGNNKLTNFWFVSVATWGIILSTYLSLEINNLWLLFIVAASLQLVIIVRYWLAKYIKNKENFILNENNREIN